MGCGNSNPKDVSLPLHFRPDGVSSDEEDENEADPIQLDPCADVFTTEKYVNGFLVRSSILGLSKIEIPQRQSRESVDLRAGSTDMIRLQLPSLGGSVASSFNGANRITVPAPELFTTNYSVINPTNPTLITNPTMFVQPTQAKSMIGTSHKSRSSKDCDDEKNTDCSEPKVQMPPISSKLSGIFLEGDLSEYTKPTVYHLFIWSRHENSRKDLFSPSFFYEAKLNEQSIRHKFKSFYVSNQDFKEAPAIIDGIMYLYTAPKDRDMIYLIYTNFKHVPSQFILCGSDEVYEEALEVAHSINAICIKGSEDYTEYLQVVIQNERRVFLLVKKIFRKIDRHRNGYVSLLDLKEIAAELGVYISELDIVQTVRSLDIDRDNRISFAELLAWWKKGRQGLKTFQNLMDNLACKITSKVLGTCKMIKSIGILNIPKIQKTLSISVGKPFTKCKTHLFVKVSDMEELGSLAQSKGSILGLRDEKLWIGFNFKTQNEISNSIIKCFKKSVKNYIASYFKNVSKEDLSDLFSIKGARHNNDALLGVYINTASPLLLNYPGLLKLSKILSDPKSLLKGHFELMLQSGVKQLMQEENRNFLISLLDGLKSYLELLHSEDTLNCLVSFLYSEYKFSIKQLIPFLIKNSKISLSFKSFKDLPNFFMKNIAENESFPSGKLLVQMIQDLIADSANKNPDLNKIFTISANHFMDELEIFLKFNDKAAQVSFRMKGLVEMLNQIIQD